MVGCRLGGGEDGGSERGCGRPWPASECHAGTERVCFLVFSFVFGCNHHIAEVFWPISANLLYALPFPPPFLQDDLFTSAGEQRAATLLAFLGTSPSPILVRHVFTGSPSAARATLRLAVAPVQGEFSRETAAGGRLHADRGAAATVAAAALANTTRRLESWQPLEGLESLEKLFRSAAGAAALGVVLGIEARQEYTHGAAFEAESVLGPLLGGLSCVLPLNEHLRVAQETAGATPFSSRSTLGNQAAQRSSEEAWSEVPVTHRLAKLLAELKSAGPRVRNALVHQYNASFEAKARNRQSFVALVEAALVKVYGV